MQRSLSSFWGKPKSTQPASAAAKKPSDAKRKRDAESTVTAAEQGAKPAATNVKAAEPAKRPKPNNRISKMALVDSDSDSDQKSSSPPTAAADTDAVAPEASVAPEPPAPSDAVAATTEVAEETTEAGASKIARPDIDPALYARLAATFEVIDSESGRIKIRDELCQFFCEVIEHAPDSLLPAVYLCCNRLGPAYAGIEIGIGDALLIKAICEATGRNTKDVKADYASTGDLGLVALQSRATQRMMFQPKPLTIQKVFDTFTAIAQESGSKSMDKKVGRIKGMMVACKGTEAKFVVRGLQGKLRIGLAEQSVLFALATAACLTRGSAAFRKVGTIQAARKKPEVMALLEEQVNVMKQLYSELPCYDEIIPALLEGGVEAARAKCALTPGVPVAPMLAKPTNGISAVLDRFQEMLFTCEYKYDGERAQVHLTEGRGKNPPVKIFSRNSGDSTVKYPDLALMLAEAFNSDVKSCILDGEVVAYDPPSGKLLPFQVLSTRSRKVDPAEVDAIKVKVIYCAFDILFLNGESLLQRPLQERRQILREHFKEVEHKFTFAKAIDASDMEEIGDFLTEAVQGNCEGLMVKTLVENATYEPSKRSLNWLKLKKDYMAGLTDSMDLVAIGAWYGKGKRTGTMGSYLLACYDEETESFQTITKIGTGFSDEMLVKLNDYFKTHDLIRTTRPTNVTTSSNQPEPDVWFEPQAVWEVKAADLSISPVYVAASGKAHATKGIALRFPRFLREREDKAAEASTNSDQVYQMYQDQGLAVQTAAAGGGDDDFEL